MDAPNIEIDTREEMNRMYRFTRHIYDFSRKYYLLGRDSLIASLGVSEGDHICEVGCGTARNLIMMSEQYPDAHFYGIDASDEMLKTARASLEKHNLSKHVQLAQAYSQNFSPRGLFILSERVNKIVFSYALSIIPPWRESIDHALEVLPEGGAMHIVDFGGQDGLPKFFRAFLFWWLSLFHVYHKPEILEYLVSLEKEGKGVLRIQHLLKGYAYLAVFTKK